MKALNNSNALQVQQQKGLLRQLLKNIAKNYAKSFAYNQQLQRAFFACFIVEDLALFSDLLEMLKSDDAQALAQSLENNLTKQIAILAYTQETAALVGDFKNSTEQLLEILKTHAKKPPEKFSQGLEIIQEVICYIAKQCQIFLAEQLFEQDAVEKLITMAMVYNIDNVSLYNQIQLAEQLLSYRELWQLAQNENSDFLTELYDNNFAFIKQLEIKNTEDAVCKLNQYFVENNALQNLDDEKLIALYDRNKNVEPQTSEMIWLLQKVHHEAQFRYNYRKFSDSSYQLLKRFESFDAIINQIDNSEFTLAETFLLRNNNFNHEILMVIAKHADNIKAVGAARNSSLNRIINHVNAGILQGKDHSQIYNRIYYDVASIKAKLASSMEPQILKRYTELDKFSVNFLKNQYVNLYDSIKALSELNVKNKNYLNQVIVRRLTQDYFTNANVANQPNKSSNVALEYTYITESLSNIDFCSLFDPEYPNNFVTLSFRKQIISYKSKNCREYVAAIVKIIIGNCSAAQLEILYKPLLHKKLPVILEQIKQQIQTEIKMRTSLSQMLYSLFTGKKSEYKKLKEVGKHFKALAFSKAQTSLFEKQPTEQLLQKEQKEEI